MLASSSSIDISPPPGIFLAGMGWNRPLSPSSHDPLTARCLVLEQEGAKWLLVTTDLIAYNKQDYDLIRQRLIRADPSLESAMLTIACSHNHSSPATYRAYDKLIREHEEIDVASYDAYLEMVANRIGEVILETNAGLEEAEIGFGMSSADVNMNRWHADKQGKAWFIPSHRELEPNLVTDRDILVFSVRSKSGSPIATVYNYAMHAITVCTQSEECTADFPGVTARLVEAEVGGECMFMGGACGNIHPVDFDRGYEACERVGKTLADAVLGVLPKMDYADDLSLGLTEREVEIQVCQPDDPALPFGEHQSMLIQAASIGNEAAFITVPGEPYIEIALHIKDMSAFKRTGIVSLANDFKGSDTVPRYHTDYFALRETYLQHEYEKTCTRPDFTFESSDNLIKAALDMLRELYRD